MPFSKSSQSCSIESLHARIRQLEVENEELRALLIRHGIKTLPEMSANVVTLHAKAPAEEYFGA